MAVKGVTSSGVKISECDGARKKTVVVESRRGDVTDECSKERTRKEEG